MEYIKRQIINNIHAFMSREQIIQNYTRQASAYEFLRQKEKRLLLILSLFRLFVFFGGFCLIWVGFNKSATNGIFAVVASLSLFCYLLYSYSRHTRKRDFYNNLVIINKNEKTALSGDISIFGSGAGYINPLHDFSNDIDIFGTSSLFQFLNRTVTGNGSDILAGWLSEPCKLSILHSQRQEALKELTENDDWYQEFLALGMLSPIRNEDIKGLIAWIEEKDDYSPVVFKVVTKYLLPLATLASFLLLVAGLLHYSFFTFLFLINLTVVGAGLKRNNRIHNMVSKKYQFLSTTELLVNAFNGKSFSSSLLSDMKNELFGNSHSAIKSIIKLSRILQSFDSRMNMLVGLLLNGLLLWDYQCIYSLQKWKRQTKDALPGWFDILGQVDALISLANFSCNHPGFVYPRKSDGPTVFEAIYMGHPLIDEDKRVCNDFAVINKGSVFVITGANMAGKSTFLRTLAVNYILAMIGAPVCASALIFKPMCLYSSMRTTDSLSQNESYFYAELKRLKTLKIRLEEDENIFFLLDEILKGTNSTDKSIGSKLFLKKIISLGGTGIIATHDISLGELEKIYTENIFNKCFEIDIDGENVSFDYKLRNGITQKMNAALLMKQMGITDESFS
jgi:DNA mismatch repair ATPase MutS